LNFEYVENLVCLIKIECIQIIRQQSHNFSISQSFLNNINMLVKYILVCCSLLTYFTSIAQTIDLEHIQDIHFKTKQDYIDFEEDLLLYLDWLENNDIDHQDRIKVNALVLKWAEGTANVTISIESYLMDCVEKNPAFLVLFIGGWSKFVLQNPELKDDHLKCNMAGVNSFLDFYKKGKDFGVVKDKKVGKLLKKREAGKLEQWIQKKI